MTHLAAIALRRIAQALRLAADVLEPQTPRHEPSASMTIYTTNGTTDAAITHG